MDNSPLSKELEILRQSLGISVDAFIKNRYRHLLVDIINSSPNEEIQNKILVFLKTYLQEDYSNWKELLNYYGTDITEL